MKRRTLTTAIICGITFFSSQVFGATPVRILRPAPGDLVATRLVSAVDAPIPTYNTNHEPVSFSWPLQADHPLRLDDRPFTKISREYWERVTASELEKGVSIDVVTPGSVIRVNPVPGTVPAGVPALEPSQLEITTRSDQLMDATSATETLAREADLERADIRFPKGTLALRLKPELGSGRFRLKAHGIQAQAGARYLVSVLEPRSPVVLAVTTSSQTFLPGSMVRSKILLQDGSRPILIETARGRVVAPDGREAELRINPLGDGSLSASLPLHRLEAGAAGMWEIKVSVVGTVDGQTVRRDLRTAFAFSLPTARLTGDTGVQLPDSTTSGLTIRFPVEVAAEGRYEVRGILYGTDAHGKLAPMGAADTAAWLPDGVGNLTLRFAPGVIHQPAFHSPYEVRDLRLMDQSRMGVLFRQRRGLVIRTATMHDTPLKHAGGGE